MGMIVLKRKGENAMKNFIDSVVQDMVSNIKIISVLFVTWIILFEKINLFVIVTGLIMSVVSILLTDMYLMPGNYTDEYMFGLRSMIHYFSILVIEIFFAGIGVIPKIILGDSDVAFVTCETKLTDKFLINILANSITLTPGTVTVKKSGSTLRVLTLDTPNIARGEDPRQVLPLKLEHVLLKYEKTVQRRGEKI